MATETAPAQAGKRQTTVYETYLRTDELLALQKPREERLHPDEVTFQVVHQTFELWWKVTVEQLAAAIERLGAERADEAARALRRAVAAQAVVMAALRQLEFVAPADFLVIRTGLGNGSGGESPGFRAILRMAPELWEAFAAALERTGVALVDLYADPAAHVALYDCAEALTDFDEQFSVFRAAHLKLAQRNLGLKAIGTGGTPMPQLERTLHDLLWPQLWEARDELLARLYHPGAAQPPVSGHGHP
jgi:tryptophan 2,3-dioxygenase